MSGDCAFCVGGMTTDPDTLSSVRCTVCGGPTGRVVCWFSCGAASAVATKLALGFKRGNRPLEIIYTGVTNEHNDNQRFLKDCEKWFDHPIRQIGNDEYARDIYEVFRRVRYLVGPSGAACTRLLKKEVRKAQERHDDIQVFGFTAEEQHRLDRLIDSNNGINVRAPLIERGLTKSDCLAMIDRAGIELPMMYRLGYANNNCIGCVKGGAGYWNKIRIDFPETFERMAKVEESLGRKLCKVTINGKRQLVSLRELPPDAGDMSDQPMECGIACELAEREIEGAA